MYRLKQKKITKKILLCGVSICYCSLWAIVYGATAQKQKQTVAKKHPMVSGSLALLYCWAAVPEGTMTLGIPT